MHRLIVLSTALLSCIALCTAAGAQTPMTCTACGEGISGPYFETGLDFYHPEHFTCGYCKEPISEGYTTYKGKSYHTPCFESHVALRCKICDGVIQGRYILDHWGNSYHLRHHGEVVMCDFCNRFIVGSLSHNMTRFDGGRFLCGLCSPEAITDLQAARGLMFQVARHLKRFGLNVDTRQIDLHLVDIRELKKVSRQRSDGLTGFTDYEQRTNLFGKVRNQWINVYILKGMPKVQMIGTLAHELTHVWVFQQGRLDHDRAFAEGSCNYAAYLVLRKVKGPQAEYIIQNMLENRDPIYGTGFRHVKIFAEKHGLASWLELLKTKNASLTSAMGAP